MIQSLMIIYIISVLVSTILLEIYCIRYAMIKRKRAIYSWEIATFIICLFIPIINIGISILLIKAIKKLKRYAY